MKTAELLVATLISFFVIGSSAWAQAPFGGTFIATLSGAQEVPPEDTLARGQAVVHASADGSELGFQLVVSHLVGVTQSHIHCGPADANGPVAVFLFGFVPGGVDVSGLLAADGITDADVMMLPDSPACPGGVSNLADLLDHMREGNAYVNVHTVANPAGEVRGQLFLAGPRIGMRRR